MTLQIVGSAPGFPHGIIDPIEVCGLLFCFFCLSECVFGHALRLGEGRGRKSDSGQASVTYQFILSLDDI